MNKFGVLKEKVLQELNEAYANGNKNEIKKILTTVIKNKDFRERYLFYEEIENKYIEDKENARLYVSEIASMLTNQSNDFIKFCNLLDKKIGNVVINENELYSSLDDLSEKDTLKNTSKKLKARIKLVEHLTTKKEQINEENETKKFTSNENLLHNVLANNFNILYDNTLTEEQKEELKKILAITTDELKTSFTTLKEEVTDKMNKMIVEEKNDEVKKKIEDVLTEMTTMDASKFNYYKLLQLKNGL